jgi:hypothetical protein
LNGPVQIHLSVVYLNASAVALASQMYQSRPRSAEYSLYNKLELFPFAARLSYYVHIALVTKIEDT